jgi:hypothetical protein
MVLDKKDKIDIVENSISWIIVLGLILYGGGKLVQFDGASDSNKMVSEMVGMEMMWAFYGYSKSFALTLGVVEIIGAMLILVKRTRIIGCLFTSAILVNIIMQDIYFDVNLGALKAALLYQFLILIILWLNRNRLINGVKILVKNKNSDSKKSKIFFKFFIAFLLFIGLRIAEYYVTSM